MVFTMSMYQCRHCGKRFPYGKAKGSLMKGTQTFPSIAKHDKECAHLLRDDVCILCKRNVITELGNVIAGNLREWGITCWDMTEKTRFGR